MTAQLTFFFTDIEASTRAWERHPEQMSASLARHDEVIQQAVKGAGGRVFKHTGDGICAAFFTATAALAAALAAQQALQSGGWRGEPLRVRMALHSGAAERRSGDFFGPPLNRTARLLDTAHGEQIVVSLVTAELLRDDLPPGVELLDLGEHRLADLARPERVFQVTQPDLAGAFPPLRSLGAHRHNLPVAPSSFVGRQRELAAFADLLRSGRLVTLCGVGGVGKTRLGLQLAAGLLEAYPDGVFIVDLAPLADPAQVAPEITRVLQLVEATDDGDTGLDRLCAYLRPRRMLLLLDNCEHLIDSVAGVCEAILRRCPEVVVLTTSREPLAVAGEVVWRVPPLGLPAEGDRLDDPSASDAVTLFCERARAAEPEFGLTSDTGPAVGRVCRRLDGIPLALELAAAWVRVLSPEQIADRLDDRFRFLSVGPRTATARQQTLRATMDWSYDLLSGAERLLLQRISVFPAGFDLGAAEAVGVDGSGLTEADVLDVLARLVDKSLVVVDGRGREARYRLLETVRDYAAEKLAPSGAEESLRRRHRDHFVRLTEQCFWADPMGEARWMTPIDREYDNLRTALEWSLTQGDIETSFRLALPPGYYLTMAGRLGEVRARVEQVLALAPADTELARARLLTLLGWVLSIQGDLEGSLPLHEEAVALVAGQGEFLDSGHAGWFLAMRLLHKGDLDRAERVITAAHSDFEAAGSLVGMGWCEYVLGWIRFARGNETRHHFEAALDLGRRGQADTLMTHCLGALAPLAALAGEAERAVALAEEGTAIARRFGLFTIVVAALTRAAEVSLLLGRWPSARAALRESLALLRQADAQFCLADSLEMAALLREADGARTPAARLLGASDGVREALVEPADVRSISAELDRCRAHLAESLPDFDSEWERGRRMSPTEATAYAVGQLEELQVADTSPAHLSVRAAVPATLRRERKGWVAGYGDAHFELPDMKGLGYLARLLAQPGHELHVLDLTGGAGAGADAGPVLDDRAKREYRHRVRELQAEIEEAESWNDPERAARAQGELDALTRQLAAAMGLGGRDRPATSSPERARVSVRKAIANAIARIAEHDPDLGLLLSTTVRTGSYCSYTPDPRLPVDWSL